MLTAAATGQAAKRRLRVYLLLLLALMLLLLAAACSSGDAASSDTRLRLTNAAGKNHYLSIEIAKTQPERERGLSGRTSLDANAGMLFFIEQQGPGFWMKDTLIPLSVAFIDPCGEIVHIEDMQPNTLDLHNSPRPYRFGLEVNLGWFERNNIGVGDHVEIPPSLRQEGCSQG
jgi:uncharacterized membrane protein (UPF0127 family)